MGILTKIVKSKFGKVMDTAAAIYSNPIKAIKTIGKETTLKELTAEAKSKPLSTQITKTVLSTAGYASVALGAASVATKGIAASAASLIPSTLKGKVIAAAAAPIVLGAVIKEPSKTLGAVASAPSELAEFGGDVATFAASPSIETAKEIIKESPIISAGLGILGVAAVGAAAANVVGGVLTREEMKKQTAAFEKQAELMGSSSVGVSGETAILPERTTITTGKKQYKRHTAKKTPSVRQSVRVNIINKPSNTGIKVYNKRYINERLLN